MFSERLSGQRVAGRKRCGWGGLMSLWEHEYLMVDQQHRNVVDKRQRRHTDVAIDWSSWPTAASRCPWRDRRPPARPPMWPTGPAAESRRDLSRLVSSQASDLGCSSVRRDGWCRHSSSPVEYRRKARRAEAPGSTASSGTTPPLSAAAIAFPRSRSVQLRAKTRTVNGLSKESSETLGGCRLLSNSNWHSVTISCTVKWP